MEHPLLEMLGKLVDKGLGMVVVVAVMVGALDYPILMDVVAGAVGRE